MYVFTETENISNIKKDFKKCTYPLANNSVS